MGDERRESDADPYRASWSLQQWAEELSSTRILSNAELEQLRECLLNEGNESRRGSGDKDGHHVVNSDEYDGGYSREELEQRLRMLEIRDGVVVEEQHDGGEHDGYNNSGAAAPTDLSAVRADYPELDEKLLLIEEKLNAEGHADTFQIIDSVSQEARIVGFDRWATAFAEHDAKYMFSHVMELAEAQRLLQEYIDDPDVKVYIGQDLLGNSVPSLDIVVQREEYGENPEILYQTEVKAPEKGIETPMGYEVAKGAIHATDKIEAFIDYKEKHPDEYNGSESPPRGSLGATVAVDPWPPHPIDFQRGKGLMEYNDRGEISITGLTLPPGKSISGNKNILDNIVETLNTNANYYDKHPIELLDKVTMIDRNGQALFEITNETPGIKPARWTWRDLRD